MKRTLLVLITLTFLIGGSFLVSKAFAESASGKKVIESKTKNYKLSKVDKIARKVDFKKLYQNGVYTHVINPNKKSYKKWVLENKKEFIPVYLDGIDQHVFEKPFTYEEWIKLNHYGIPPN